MGWDALIKRTDGNINLELGSQPCTLRCYPGLPNFMLHGIAIYDENKQRVFELTRYRSSILYPISVKNEKNADVLAQNNLEQLVFNHQRLTGAGDAPVLLVQTLVSALNLPGFFGYERKMREKKAKSVIEFSLAHENSKIIETNYPFNKWHPG